MDKASAAEIGKIAGADIILYGTVTKYKYDSPFSLNPFKRKDKGIVEVTARLANAKTAEIVTTIQVKGEALEEKVDLSEFAGAKAGSDDYKAAIMNQAVYDAANKLAAELEKRSEFAGSPETKPPVPSSPAPGSDAKSKLAQQSVQDQKAQPQPPSPAKPQTPQQPSPSNPEKVGLVSKVVGNVLLIAVEQDGGLKVGDKLMIKRMKNPIPDPYNPGKNLGYEFMDIGYAIVTEIVSNRVVKSTFVAVGRRGAVRVFPRFQDWAVTSP